MSDLSNIVKEAKNVVLSEWDRHYFDHLSFAVLDFKSKEFGCFTLKEGADYCEPTFFDLASLTKPLTLGAFFHQFPEKLTEKFRLLLEHRAGFKAWSVLGSSTWKETLLSYKIRQSEVRYSDLSFLRLMLELEKTEGKSLQELCRFYWDDELLFWKDLDLTVHTPQNGWRHGRRIIGEVNDDNCYRLGRFCSHAGLFATVEGLSKSLFRLEDQTGFVGQMNCDHQYRFDRGWDSVSGENSLAGSGMGPKTFGHLGFTGTNIWIDPEANKGWILLTNTVKDYWYEKKELGELRRKLGSIVWRM